MIRQKAWLLWVPFLGALVNLWHWIRYTAWLLWICRVPFVSAVVGALVYALAPQARDLGLEVHGRDFNWSDAGFTAAFILAVLFGWMSPIRHTSVELIERLDQTQLGATRAGERIRHLLPIILALVALLGLLVGQLGAWWDVKSIHYGDNIEIWMVPNIILLIHGSMVIFAVYIACEATPIFFQNNGRKPFAIAVGSLFLTAILWTLLVRPYGPLIDAGADIRGWLESLLAWCLPLICALVIVAVRYYVHLRNGPGVWERFFRSRVAPLVAVLLTALFLFGPPTFITETLGIQRAILAPLLFGVWVPVLGLIGFYSHRTSVPLLFVGGLALALIAYLKEGHRIETLNDHFADRRPSLTEALKLWRQENCSGDARCAPMILIATQGGASRSAFFTATALGELLDRKSPDSPPDNGERSFVRSRQIFAISGVSGGALGAAVFSAALSDGRKSSSSKAGIPQPRSLGPPCQPPSVSTPSEWHGSSDDEKVKNYQNLWRSCLQALVSGDYLSPVMIRLAFSDFLSWPNLFGSEDRGRALTRAWERGYQRLTHKDTLHSPFMQVAPSDEAGWRPLLILNGSSVQTGRRILASHLSPWVCTSSSERPRRLFPDAYDLHELVGGSEQEDCRCTKGELICNDNVNKAVIRKRDVTLSEAISISTRFPLISPSGALLNDTGKTIDRVVDGGYFETAGISTIFDLARAIHSVDRKLEIRVLLITNDPNMEQTPCVPPDNDAAPLPANTKGKFYEIAEISAVLSARTGRSQYAAVAACEGLASHATFARIAVYRPASNAVANAKKTKPEASAQGKAAKNSVPFEGISMSWWLSKHVQLYIDTQLGNGIFSPHTDDDICRSVSGASNDGQLCKVILRAGPP